MEAQSQTKQLNLIPLAFPTSDQAVSWEIFNRRQLFEFYADANVEDYIQLPWTSITAIGANVFSGKKVSRHFEIWTDKENFSLAPKTLVRFSKLLVYIGNDKVKLDRLDSVTKLLNLKTKIGLKKFQPYFYIFD